MLQKSGDEEDRKGGGVVIESDNVICDGQV